MKKIISLVLILTLSLFAFAACGGKDNDDDNTPTEKNYSLAIGVDMTIDEKEVANTVAVIVIDENGKVVSCRLDALALEAAFADGAIDESKTYQSKREKGDNYNMVAWGGAIAEWYKQAEAFESYVIGKTQAEINGIAVNEDGKPTDATLAAGCTMAVSEFIKAIDNAFNSVRKVTFKTAAAITVGASVTGDVSDDEGSASYAADFAGVVMADGKIVAAIIDSNEVTASIEGGAISTFNSYKGTKLYQGDNYNMVAWGGAIAEWYAQAQTFANTSVGKTAAEVAGLSIEGVAGCTIYAGGYRAALEKAANAAR